MAFLKNDSLAAMVESFENTSDGLRQNEKIKSTYLPYSLVKRAIDLKNKNIIPSFETIIINNHEELSIDIDNTDSFARALEAVKNLKNVSGKRIELEPSSEMLDLYAIFPEEKTTQRLRYYFQNGVVASARIFIADESLTRKEFWRCRNFKMPARRDCIFALRADTDAQKNNQDTEIITNNFLDKDKLITAIVFKNVIRGNFGDETKWGHRSVYWRENSKIKSKDLHWKKILGMSHYLYPALQKIEQIILPKPISAEFAKKLCLRVLKNRLTPLKCFQLLSGRQKTKSYCRIEIESRGEKFKKDAAFLGYQLTRKKQLFDSFKIEYRFTTDRKINFKNN